MLLLRANLTRPTSVVVAPTHQLVLDPRATRPVVVVVVAETATGARPVGQRRRVWRLGAGG